METLKRARRSIEIADTNIDDYNVAYLSVVHSIVTVRGIKFRDNCTRIYAVRSAIKSKLNGIVR